MKYIVNGQFAQITAVVNGKEVDVIETILKQQQEIFSALYDLTPGRSARRDSYKDAVEHIYHLLNNDEPGGKAA